ncbi:hypothetical protein ACFL3J_02235 [Candidatus Omnitrophota bacterium]
MNKTLLFNPINMVHDKNVSVFKKFLPDWNMRCIYNSKFPWFSGENKRDSEEAFYFTNRYFKSIPKGAFDNVKAVILFTAQLRIPPCNLIQEAAMRSIPVIVVEEAYQMMLEQGFVNNYFLPVDHLFAASDYERENFIKIGVPGDVVETTGCMLRYREPVPEDSSRADSLKKKLNIPADKPVATLCLASLSPSGETTEIRKELLTCASRGLPDKYELLIKPHPYERDKNFHSFVRQYAPNANIADPRISFDRILEISDIILNRGNSQVIIDAMQKGIPVAVIPTGRKTVFHGLLSEVVINESKDLVRVVNTIKTKGRGIYNEMFQKYLSITPEQAAENVTSRIKEIAEKQELYRPEERLLELALFWAWMGYDKQARRTLINARGRTGNHPLIEKISRLVSCKANRDEIAYLKEWCGDGYRQWILQSLWIKTLYLTGKKMNSCEKDWLSNFPPRMNRSKFLNYAIFLYWCYERSGMSEGGEVLLDKLYKEFSALKNIERLKSQDSDKHNKFRFALHYFGEKFNHSTNLALKNFLWRAETLGRCTNRG